MNDQNRYEEVPQKENKFKKGLKAFGSYLKFVFVDFFNSFKYNNMKLAAILFAMPGILLGFFMFAHVPTVRHVKVSYERDLEGSKANITVVENAETTVDTDYALTIDKYTVNGTEYSGIKFVLSDKVDNEDMYPVDGTTTDAALTAALTPSIAGFSQKLDESKEEETYLDTFKIKIVYKDASDNVLANDAIIAEIRNIDKYNVFVYEKINDNYYYTGFSASIEAKNVITETDNDADLFTTSFNLDTLSPTKEYGLVVKAVPQKEKGLYTSKLSSVFETAGLVKKDGDGYNIDATKYAKVAGNYVVESYNNGSTPDDNLKKFTMVVEADGTIYYKVDGNDDVKASLSGTVGTNDFILTSQIKEKVRILPFDFSSISIFLLTLVGFLNVFLSLELSKKKNLGTVVKCSLTTAAIVLLGAAYIYSIIATENAMKLPEGKRLNLPGITTIIDSNAIISIVTVSLAALFSVAGLVLAFINYDRTYEKVDR